jgi:glycosyltransferase involved in cell wall biosynthesis
LYFSKKYKPVSLPKVITYCSTDVSIIVPTIDTESTFTECVRLWLKSKPREIIIVTVPRCKAHVEQLVMPIHEFKDKITILTAPLANKRHQLMVGSKAASGKIHALVDDDAYWPADTVIPHLLAPFEDDRVGAAAGLQRSVHEAQYSSMEVSPLS